MVDTHTFIRHALNQAHERLQSSLEGLSERDITWRPAPGANTIVEILWHLVRAEDRMARTAAAREQSVWDAGRWFERLRGPGEGSGEGEYRFLEGGARAPERADLVAYMHAVHRSNVDALQHVSSDGLDRVPDPAQPTRTVAALYRHMITHKNNHHGQIDYIRGLLQPGWELPPGTGVAQR